MLEFPQRYRDVDGFILQDFETLVKLENTLENIVILTSIDVKDMTFTYYDLDCEKGLWSNIVE